MGVPRPVYDRIVTYTSVHVIVNDWILSFTIIVMLDLGKDGYWIFIYVQSSSLLKILDERMSIGFSSMSNP